MGYTHYWTLKREITKAEFDKLKELCCDIFEDHKDILANGDGEEGTRPELRGVYIEFNGIEYDSHEPLYISTTSKGFHLCKTNKKPYDVAVVKVLKALKDIMGDDVELSSDGGDKVFD